jgi:hypothetical protein
MIQLIQMFQLLTTIVETEHVKIGFLFTNELTFVTYSSMFTF